MTTTQDWLEARRTALGASDTPIVLGLTTWGSPKEVQCRKLGLLPPGESSPHLEWRKKLEGPMTEHFMANRAGWDCTRDPSLMLEVLDGESAKCNMTAFPEAAELWCVSTAYPWLGASPDALCWNARQVAILEFKTAYDRSEWKGEDGLLRVPEHYQVQVQQQMMVTGLRKAVVVVSFGGGSEPPEILEVDYDRDMAEEIAKRTAEWWDRHIKGGEEVDLNGSASERQTIDALADLTAGREIEGDTAMRAATSRIITLGERIAEIQKDQDKLKAHIREAMQKAGAERMVFPGGDAWIYKQDKRGRYSLRYAEVKP